MNKEEIKKGEAIIAEFLGKTWYTGWNFASNWHQFMWAYKEFRNKFHELDDLHKKDDFNCLVLSLETVNLPAAFKHLVNLIKWYNTKDVIEEHID